MIKCSVRFIVGNCSIMNRLHFVWENDLVGIVYKSIDEPIHWSGGDQLYLTLSTGNNGCTKV